MTTPKAAPDVLAMTVDDIAALVTDAQTEASKAAGEVRLAEQVLRGETPAEEVPKALRDVTPAQLAGLRQNAEYANLKVAAAERRAAEIHEQQLRARQAEVRAMLEAAAADDVNQTQQLTDALDAFEKSLKGLCEAFTGHNERIATWSRLMGEAGIPRVHAEHRGPGVLSHRDGGKSVSVDEKVFRPMQVGGFIGAAVYRVLSEYPRDFIRHRGTELTELGDIANSGVRTDRHGRIDSGGRPILYDLHESIKRNA